MRSHAVLCVTTLGVFGLVGCAESRVGSHPTAPIQLSTPSAGAVVRSPLRITGRAPGPWFFEASFPVTLLDAHGNVLARAPASAKAEWMTEAWVPFEAELSFKVTEAQTGTLVLEKDNPSGEAAHAAEQRFSVELAP